MDPGLFLTVLFISLHVDLTVNGQHGIVQNDQIQDKITAPCKTWGCRNSVNHRTLVKFTWDPGFRSTQSRSGINVCSIKFSNKRTTIKA